MQTVRLDKKDRCLPKLAGVITCIHARKNKEMHVSNQNNTSTPGDDPAHIYAVMQIRSEKQYLGSVVIGWAKRDIIVFVNVVTLAESISMNCIAPIMVANDWYVVVAIWGEARKYVNRNKQTSQNRQFCERGHFSEQIEELHGTHHGREGLVCCRCYWRKARRET